MKHPQRILIMGLPGSGKTTLAQELKKQLQQAGRTVKWLNADEVRTTYNDWDFSESGRIRQSQRMRALADKFATDYVIADFVAPLIEMRENFDADCTIWVNTIKQGRFDDTNTMFQPPSTCDFCVTEQDCETWANIIKKYLIAAHQVNG
jgi:adenylylsulfate kinase